jgi:uncharacterized protein YcaQ
VTVHQLSRRDACRIAVRAQLLQRRRPAGLLEAVRHLTLLQLEPTAAVAPSADLVGWSRLGRAYRPQELADALERHALIELHGYARPAEDLALFRAEMAGWAKRKGLRDWEYGQREWVRANDSCRRDILALLDADGPMPLQALPDTTKVPWRSSGWNNSRNVTMLLELMVERGEVAVAGRRGRERLWDLAERVYPDDDPVPEADALRLRNERRLRALGIARAHTTGSPGEPWDVGEVGEAATVDGVRGAWRVDPEQLRHAQADRAFAGRVALLSPFDRLVFDRKRTLELFEFGYALEMYKPASQRRWGFYALPILDGDVLIGKLDATAEHASGLLRVRAIHEDVPFAPATRAAVTKEIKDLAAWLRLEPALPAQPLT